MMIEDSSNFIPLDKRSEYLTVATDLLKHSRSVFKKYSSSGFGVQHKSDKTIVTEVDIEIETALRKVISNEFPEHGIRGEELSDHNPDSEFQWIIDPIDGTEQFVSGVPTYGTILSLYYKEQPLVGVVDHPGLNITLSAVSGLGTCCNGSRVARISPRNAIAHTEPRIVTAKRANFLRRNDDSYYFERIGKRFPSFWVFDNCYSHTVVITGAAAAMVEYNVKFCDISALKLLIEEAGGVYQSLYENTAGENDTYYSAVCGLPDVVQELVDLYQTDT
jgi:fructose-1,6-bisphosphatase/inositol monophosphatase family enzyme